MILSEPIQKTLQSECANYIKKLRNCTPGSILLRGFFGKIDILKKFHHNLEFRKPRNTPENIHNLINARFEEEFGWKIRNGAFCYGFNLRNKEEPKELGYGPFYICFPVGNFKIVYSPTIIDMYGPISLSKKPIETILDEVDFTDEDLCKAIESGDRKHQNVSNEISIGVSSYYLIDYKFKDCINALIWKPS